MNKKYSKVHFVNQSKREHYDWMGGKPTGELIIGKEVALNDSIIDHTGGVEIKDYVHFGRQVMLLSCEHPPGLFDGMKRRLALKCGKITIEKNAYIGSRAVILEGVNIGESAYIASGAVVVKDVEAKTLVGGVPAKLIRRLK